MYLRVKRKNTTTLLHVEPSDSFQLIKQRIATLFSIESHQVMLLGSDKTKELVELATVSDQELRNDDVIYAVFVKSGGTFEDVDVVDLVPFGETDPDSTV